MQDFQELSGSLRINIRGIAKESREQCGSSIDAEITARLAAILGCSPNTELLSYRLREHVALSPLLERRSSGLKSSGPVLLQSHIPIRLTS